MSMLKHLAPLGPGLQFGSWGVEFTVGLERIELP